jgi:hypothetical protein
LDWVRNPFALSAFESEELTLAEQDELTEIRNERRLKPKHSSTVRASIWLSLQQEYPIIIIKVTEAPPPFSASYLLEAGFSAMNTIKTRAGRGFKLWRRT